MSTATTTSVDMRPGGLWLAFSHNRLAWVGLILLGLIISVAVLAPWLAPHDPLEQNIAVRLEPPSAEYWLGTDTYGRDVLSRLIHGARVSLFVGFAAILIAMVVGTTIGVIAGYVGGLFDQLVMGVLDVMLAFPTLLLGLMIAAPFARVARAPTITLRQSEFVEASRSYGCGPVRIMGRHILPNMMSDVVVMSSLWLASAIRTEASLSFIGLGVPPPAATWGGMIREGFENILDAWWLAVFPSMAILLTVLALNLLGDALRDATDPKTQGR
jgi:peptide/nickel transport system permease protein